MIRVEDDSPTQPFRTSVAPQHGRLQPEDEATKDSKPTLGRSAWLQLFSGAPAGTVKTAARTFRALTEYAVLQRISSAPANAGLAALKDAEGVPEDLKVTLDQLRKAVIHEPRERVREAMLALAPEPYVTLREPTKNAAPEPRTRPALESSEPQPSADPATKKPERSRLAMLSGLFRGFTSSVLRVGAKSA